MSQFYEKTAEYAYPEDPERALVRQRVEEPVQKQAWPVPTRRGWAFAVTTLVFLFLGAITQDVSAVRIALFLMAVGVCAWFLAKANVQKLDFRRVAPEYVYAGADFELELSLVNRKRWLDSFGVEVKDSLLQFGDRESLISRVKAGESRKWSCHTRMIDRGEVREKSFRIRSTFPLGLFEIRYRLRSPIGIMVFPKPEIPKALAYESEMEIVEGGTESSWAPDAAGDFRGIREFQSGDPVKTIHWRATARSQRLMVCERDRPVLESASILFHSFSPPNTLVHSDRFDHSMELLAGLLFHCQQRSMPLDLTAAFTGWETIAVPDPQYLISPLRILARARHTVQRDIDTLNGVLRRLPGTHRIYILSDTPVKHWAHLLPDLPRLVTCLDNSDFRVRKASVAGFTRTEPMTLP